MVSSLRSSNILLSRPVFFRRATITQQQQLRYLFAASLDIRQHSSSTTTDPIMGNHRHIPLLGFHSSTNLICRRRYTNEQDFFKVNNIICGGKSRIESLRFFSSNTDTTTGTPPNSTTPETDKVGKTEDEKTKVEEILFEITDDVTDNKDKIRKGTVKGIDKTKFTEEISIKMPDFDGAGGKIIKWYKKEGDIVKWDDIICDIETPDFTYGMEVDEEELGIMGKILIQAPSETIKGNDVICILLHEKKDD